MLRPATGQLVHGVKAEGEADHVRPLKGALYGRPPVAVRADMAGQSERHELLHAVIAMGSGKLALDKHRVTRDPDRLAAPFRQVGVDQPDLPDAGALRDKHQIMASAAPLDAQMRRAFTQGCRQGAIAEIIVPAGIGLAPACHSP